jgi:HSP20 family molecular chaperone IbpA
MIETNGWVILTCPLPGLEKEHIKIAFGEGQIHIVGFNGDRRYKTSAPIPDVDLESFKQTLHNGVLELSYRLASATTEGVEKTEKKEKSENIEM